MEKTVGASKRISAPVSHPPKFEVPPRPKQPHLKFGSHHVKVTSCCYDIISFWHIIKLCWHTLQREYLSFPAVCALWKISLSKGWGVWNIQNRWIWCRGREASIGLGECSEMARFWSLAEMPRSTNKSAHYLIEAKPGELIQSWTTQSERASCILSEGWAHAWSSQFLGRYTGANASLWLEWGL